MGPGAGRSLLLCVQAFPSTPPLPPAHGHPHGPHPTNYWHVAEGSGAGRWSHSAALPPSITQLHTLSPFPSAHATSHISLPPRLHSATRAVWRYTYSGGYHAIACVRAAARTRVSVTRASHLQYQPLFLKPYRHSCQITSVNMFSNTFLCRRADKWNNSRIVAEGEQGGVRHPSKNCEGGKNILRFLLGVDLSFSTGSGLCFDPTIQYARVRACVTLASENVVCSLQAWSLSLKSRASSYTTGGLAMWKFLVYVVCVWIYNCLNACWRVHVCLAEE